MAREQMLTVRLSDEEMARLRAAASEADQTVGDYVRERALRFQIHGKIVRAHRERVDGRDVRVIDEVRLQSVEAERFDARGPIRPVPKPKARSRR